jgi:hypothetical protein
MKDFNSIKNPMDVSQQPKRQTVGKETNAPGRVRNPLQEGIQKDNPRHEFNTELERIQWSGKGYQPGDPVVTKQGHPTRAPVNHTAPNRSKYSAHMGTSGKSHGFAGANYGRKRGK